MIYDLVYNDCGEYVVITPQEIPLELRIVENGISLVPEKFVCEHRHTIVYVWKGLTYKPEITLQLNGKSFGWRVSRYPDLTGKVVLSTLVLREELWIRQWICHHARLGVDHFVVYDNAGESSLRQFLEAEIAAGLVTYIPWKYPYRLPRSGISGQTTQQNHSIYTWRRAAYIGLLDVDEFVNPRGDRSIRDWLNAVVAEDRDSVGGVELVSRIYAPPTGFERRAGSTEFFKAAQCTEWIRTARQKVFVIPSNVEIFSVHMIVTGKPKRTADPETELCFNHYWFLSSKPVREQLAMPCQDTTILRHCQT